MRIQPPYIQIHLRNGRLRSNRSNGCETSSQVFHNLLHFSTLLYTSPYLRYFTKDLKLKKILSGVGLIHLWPDPIFGCLHGRFGLKRAVTVWNLKLGGKWLVTTWKVLRFECFPTKQLLHQRSNLPIFIMVHQQQPFLIRNHGEVDRELQPGKKQWKTR